MEEDKSQEIKKMNKREDFMNDFETKYFIQTRQEIDTEKRERDIILNFAVVVLGALGFAILRNDKADEFLLKPYSFMFEISVLIILTSLFYVRRKKLQQISDRWFTLHRMVIRHFNEQQAAETMEATVIESFNKGRYKKKDLILNFALSSPVYILLFISAFGFSCCMTIRILTPIIIIMIHIIISLIVLMTKMRDPFPPLLSTGEP
ncbi:MAG: hypothetical protein JW806_02080 [Sedimentisphaerales bacterium]|nr:hypothetical protein [Sedimentisphaerales bacterium]